MRVWLMAWAGWAVMAQTLPDPKLDAQTDQLRQVINRAPRSLLKRTELALRPPKPGWEVGMISSVAVSAGPKPTIYLLQRGLVADPVIAIDETGRVLRSWGAGLFQIPHSIRLDPQGYVWTVDAASSNIYKFSPDGKLLQTISVGGQPVKAGTKFVGTADIAFGPNGHLYIADGYGNARILEYSTTGERLREWGKHGTGPGEFNLPHGIAVDPQGVIYVADRENGRIQRFDLNGKYLGEWPELGKTFSITFHKGYLFIGTQPRNAPNTSPGWLMSIDPRTGQINWQVESTGQHSVALNDQGELLNGSAPNRLVYFRRK
ncbi:MAG: peptidyl-alpha-hydroxyglycine alpha-amidating lyase family protein [Acidobacteria bacterium]|nr:peptidyl-alpha-hydroxyglycine alpha-amidating lyase family protein [Acidobacteriota bacterium]